MARFLFVLICIVFAASGCNTAPDKRGSDTPAPATGAAMPESSTSCYRQIVARDTFSLQLQSTGTRLSGTLSFHNHEKDSSHGPVTGTEEGGVLKLWYRFESEGMESVQQVFFKREGDALLRGTGDVASKGDSAYFRQPSDVTFSAKDRWEKADCVQ